jgi:hypothetical protein
MKKPISQYKIKNRYLPVLFLIMYCIGSLIALPVHQNISADQTYYCDFDNSVPTGQVQLSEYGGFIYSEKSSSGGTFYVSTTGYHSAPACFNIKSVARGNFSFVYSETTFLTNISFWMDTDSASSHFMRFTFYNKTLGLDNPIIYWYQDYNAVDKHNEKYTDATGTTQTLASAVTNNYYEYYIRIDNDYGYCTYGRVGAYATQGTVRNATAINQNYRIDALDIWNTPYSNYNIWIDDLALTFSTSYEGGNISGSCANAYNGYSWIGTGFSNAQTDIDTGRDFLEFSYDTEISGTFIGFELLISNTMWSEDNDLDNYYLYINGFSEGNPCGRHTETYGVVLEWSFTLTLDDPVNAVIELYYGGEYSGWRIVHQQHTTGSNYYTTDYVYVTNTNSIDGIYGGTGGSYLEKRAMWKLFIYEFTEDNPDYDDTLDVVGESGLNATDDLPFTYVYRTIFFNAQVSTLTDPRYIYVYKNDVQTGNTQGYPIRIRKYNGMYGFTPYAEGLYNVTLENATVLITKQFYVYDVATLDFAIWSYPNPSYLNNEYTVACFINSTTYDQYALRVFENIPDSLQYNRAFGGSIVGALTDHVWAFQFSHMVDYQDHFWRIFGSDDGVTWLPIGSYHRHIIDRGISESAWLTVTPNPCNLGETVTIKGYHAPSFDTWLFVGSQQWNDVSSLQTFTRTRSFENAGTILVSMKQMVNGTYVDVCDPVVVTVRGETNGETGGILPRIDQPLGSIVGMIITMFCLLAPLGIMKGLNMNSSPSGFLYMFGGGIGIAISTVLGLFPVWIPLFILAFGVCIALILYFMKNKNDSGE